jgi:hypothetical protein
MSGSSESQNLRPLRNVGFRRLMLASLPTRRTKSLRLCSPSSMPLLSIPTDHHLMQGTCAIQCCLPRHALTVHCLVGLCKVD